MSIPSKKMKTDSVSSAISPGDIHPKVDVVLPRRAFLEDVSLDILLEVFSHLHPQDLLLMSRMSKTFRAFLMSRRSALVWKEARVRTSSDAPPCPPHMSEPQYAVLLFTQRCTVCGGSAEAQMPFWAFYARYCPSCDEKEVVRVFPRSVRHEVTDAMTKAGYKGSYVRNTPRGCGWNGVMGWGAHGSYRRQDVAQFRALWERCASSEEKTKLLETSIADVNKWMEETSAITAWGKKQAPLYARMKKEHIEAIGVRIVVLKRALEAHLASLGPRNAASDTRAHLSDLVLRPACRQLLQAPTSHEVTSDDFLGMLDALEQEWHEEREREFEALVSERYPGLPSAKPHLPPI